MASSSFLIYNTGLMNIAVGMSGGVDSSVAALLLKNAGHDVAGIMMKLWREPAPKAVTGSACYGPDEEKDIEAARGVCARLHIPFYLFDCSKNYEDLIVRDVREEYLAGRTPNPCVRCNPLIKFGLLPEAARQSGLAFDHFATGHYARVAFDETSDRFLLKTAADPRKDQSYFLYRLSQDQLSRAVFPLGEFLKNQVRKMARDADLPVHDHPDSQDFYSGDLSELICGPMAEGDIVDRRGAVLGKHTGIWKYTIGQRKGLGLSSSVPLYVIAIDAGRNLLVVGPESETYRQSCFVKETAWIACDQLMGPLEALVKIRSTSKPARARISPAGNVRALVEFAEPLSAVTPGQSAVFYRDDVVVGGGIIENPA
jgi:tRNA-specific 2-thiouridylase